jgi:hypothetical protein
MSNSITNLKNYFEAHNGLQRDNRYKVTFWGIDLPGMLGQNDEYFTTNVSVGSRAIDAIADNLSGYGPGRVIPRSQKFAGGVLVTFPVTTDSHILTMFNAWFNRLHSGSLAAGYRGAPFLTGYYDSNVANASMQITLLDPNGNANSAFTFFEVFPLETMPFKLDMASTNNFMTYTVLFNYREFDYQSAATNTPTAPILP